MSQNTDTAVRYTVYSPNSGTVYGQGLTVREAASEILRYDDRAYEVVPDAKYEGWWNLLRSPYSRSSGFKSDPTPLSGYFVQASSEDEAWDILAAKVVADDWNDGKEVGLEAMTDEAFDAAMSQAMAADEAE